MDNHHPLPEPRSVSVTEHLYDLAARNQASLQYLERARILNRSNEADDHIARALYLCGRYDYTIPAHDGFGLYFQRCEARCVD